MKLRSITRAGRDSVEMSASWGILERVPALMAAAFVCQSGEAECVIRGWLEDVDMISSKVNKSISKISASALSAQSRLNVEPEPNGGSPVSLPGSLSWILS